MPESLNAVEVAAAFLLGLVCIAVAVVLLRPVWLPVWRLFQGTQQFLEDWFGEPARAGQDARPGAMQRLQSIEKEMHPNGGSSLRDDVRKGLSMAERAAEVSESAANKADALGSRLEEVGVAAHQERVTLAGRLDEVRDELGGRLTAMREEVAQDAAQRTADAFELLAEHGGPDMRDHLPGVPPHAHALPARIDPTLTGGPVEPEE